MVFLNHQSGMQQNWCNKEKEKEEECFKVELTSFQHYFPWKLNPLPKLSVSIHMHSVLGELSKLCNKTQYLSTESNPEVLIENKTNQKRIWFQWHLLLPKHGQCNLSPQKSLNAGKKHSKAEPDLGLQDWVPHCFLFEIWHYKIIISGLRPFVPSFSLKLSY